MKKLLLIIILFSISYCLFSQNTEYFNYQAVVRDNLGTVIENQNVSIKISILQSSSSGTSVYSEEHNVTTNQFGLVNLEIGGGNTISGDFTGINWGADIYFLQIEIDPSGGTSYQLMGSSQLLAVPYALYSLNSADSSLWEKNANDIYYNTGNVGVGTISPNGRLQVNSDSLAGINDVIFSVLNAQNDTVFAVYQEGVRIWVSDDTTGAKANGSRGGFAVGGFNPSKSFTNEYLRVTPDSVRVYIQEGTGGAKATGSRGGFAVGGFSPTKAATDYYLNIEHNDVPEVINSSPRMLWYPYREAFRVGRVLITSADSVGINSFATGFNSQAIGDYSHALGYEVRAMGFNSTAIGYYAQSNGNNSLAIGDSAIADSDDCFAIGTGAYASGRGSFAIGSKDRLFMDNFVLSTSATGELSMAVGLDADATADQSVAVGNGVHATGVGSAAFGSSSTASGDYSTALRGVSSGFGALSLGGEASGYLSLSTHTSLASGWVSTAIGSSCEATHDYTVAIGYNADATGNYAHSMGNNSIAQAASSFVIGSYNIVEGNTTAWVNTDPLFVIGNGTFINPHNAITVLKDGKLGIGTNTPMYNVHLLGDPTLATLLITPNETGSEASSELILSEDNDYTFGMSLYYDGVANQLQVRAKMSTVNYGPWLTIDRDDGEVRMPQVYADVVGATNRDLYIDDAGKIGYLSSSKRYKKGIMNMENIDWLYNLRPVNYSYKKDENGTKQYGLIAEEVEKVNPLFVSYNENGQAETVNYSMFISPILKALIDQKEENIKLKAENEEIKARLEKIEALLNSSAKK